MKEKKGLMQKVTEFVKDHKKVFQIGLGVLVVAGVGTVAYLGLNGNGGLIELPVDAAEPVADAIAATE